MTGEVMDVGAFRRLVALGSPKVAWSSISSLQGLFQPNNWYSPPPVP